MEFICDDISELPAIARALIDTYPASKIFAFYGNMGSGKTTFIKAICEYLKVDDMSNSPSFGIINEYMTKKNEPVYHFDFYRLKSVTEFFDLGCEEYFYGGDYCLIEWPEKIEECLPEEKIIVQIFEKSNKRIFRF